MVEQLLSEDLSLAPSRSKLRKASPMARFRSKVERTMMFSHDRACIRLFSGKFSASSGFPEPVARMGNCLKCQIRPIHV